MEKDTGGLKHIGEVLLKDPLFKKALSPRVSKEVEKSLPRETVKKARRVRIALTSLSKAELAVLLVLRDHAGPDWLAWPSQKTIAVMTGLSIASVKKAIKGLKKKGLIVDKGAKKSPLSEINPKGRGSVRKYFTDSDAIRNYWRRFVKQPD